MGRKSNADLMFELVREYLDGPMPRMFFDMDFDHYLIKYYPAMERQNPDMAGCFAYYLSEQGADISAELHRCTAQKAHSQTVEKVCRRPPRRDVVTMVF